MVPISNGRAIYSLELRLLPLTPSSRVRHATLARYYSYTKAVASNATTSASPRSISKEPSFGLNPPPSSRASLLELPTRLPDQRAYKYYFSVGKTYLQFYKNGFKDIFQNIRSARSIGKRLGSSYTTTPEKGVRNGLISRAEWHFLDRLRTDVLRLPQFLLILMVCGEFTPFVVIFFSGAIPRRLWIPKQVQKVREKSEARRREVFRNPPAGLDIDRKEAEHQIIPGPEVLHIGRSLGLYSSLWDRIDLPPLWLIRRRIKKRMDFVELDDFAIRRDGDIEELEAAEVLLAAEMRGLDVLGRKESDLRRDLSDWLLNGSRLAEQGLSARRLYLTRSAAWPHHHAIP